MAPSTQHYFRAPSQGVSVGATLTSPALRLDLVHAFVVLAEELNVTRAAARLFLTQPGMSRRLEALERTVGTSLVDRTTRPMRLTQAGGAFLPHAVQLVAAGRCGVDAATSAAASPLRAVG